MIDIEHGPRILAVRDRYVPGGTSNGCQAVAVPDAFTREWPTDVHLSMYAAPDPLMRLRHDLMPPTVNVVLLMADADGPDHARTAEWDRSIRERAAHLPGSPFVPWTRGGARIIYTRELEVTDPEVYTREVLLDLVAIYAVSGIVCDAECSDITRITRAVHATRDGKAQALGWVRGEATRPGPWVRPAMTEAEILTALGALSAQSKAWRSRACRFAPRPEHVVEPSSAPTGDLEKRAARYLAKLPASISKSHGHQALWTAALAMVRGFCQSPERALSLLRSEFNPRCKPPWSDKELRHKVNDAENDATTEYGYLANAPLKRAS